MCNHTSFEATGLALWSVTAKTIFDIVNEKQSQIEKKTEFSKETS
jgi:hypothetical protein